MVRKLEIFNKAFLNLIQKKQDRDINNQKTYVARKTFFGSCYLSKSSSVFFNVIYAGNFVAFKDFNCRRGLFYIFASVRLIANTSFFLQRKMIFFLETQSKISHLLSRCIEKGQSSENCVVFCRFHNLALRPIHNLWFWFAQRLFNYIWL